MAAEGVGSVRYGFWHYYNDDGLNLLESRNWMKEKIVQALKDPNVSTIGIHGLGGVGKTSLALQVARQVDGDVFDVVCMTSVSSPPNVGRIQRDIARQLDLNISYESSEEDITARIYRRIMLQRSVLIILDDIWDAIDGFLRTLAENKVCKLLLISRSRRVLRMSRTQQDFRLDVLNDAEPLSLFQAVVGVDVLMDANLRNTATQLVQRCSGLPLAIVEMATSLKGRLPLVWKRALANLDVGGYWDVMEQVFRSLRLSYDHLKDQAKQVFLLCGVYGKSILVSDLLKYVIGLGIFKDVDSIHYARRALHRTIDDLKDSSLVIDHNGEREIQIINDLIRDFAKSVASSGDDGGYVSTMTSIAPWEDWARKDFLGRCSHMILEGHYIQQLPERLDCPNLKLLLLDSTRNCSLEIPESFFEGMANLRVLGLMGMVIQPQLPRSLVSLTKLKTLCFNACSLGYMTGIGALRDLEILSFFGSSMKELPSEMVKLTRLRMLDLSSYKIEAIIPFQIISNFTRLEELYMGAMQKEHDILDGGTTIDETESIPVRSLTLQHSPEINGFWCIDPKSLDIPTLFPIDKDLFHPMKHLKLISISRIMVLVITALSNGMVPLQNLETLEIVDCNDLQYLFVIKVLSVHGTYGGLLPHLRRLRLSKLGNFRSIVGPNFPGRTLMSFKMLNQLIVCSCNQLRYVLPLYVLQNLQGLENIVISDCEMLERVFGDEEETQMRQLPCSCPNLKEIHISDCPSLQDFVIDTEIKADDRCFAKLESVLLVNLPMLSSFILKIFEFSGLRKVSIVNCPKIKTSSRNVSSAKANNFMDTDSSESPEELDQVLYDAQEDSLLGHGKTILLPQLQEPESSDLPKMPLRNQEPQIPMFEKLASLKIIGCGSIKMLFSISVAQHLPSLKFLTLYKCENMVQVLQGGGENSVRVLQKLETLVLKHMPRLTSFCEDVGLVHFPELKMVRVEHVPNMITFTRPHPPTTPKLKEVYVTYVNKCWRGDLNETISDLHNNHREKLRKGVWKTDCSSPGKSPNRSAYAAESSSQGMKRTSWRFREEETELH